MSEEERPSARVYQANGYTFNRLEREHSIVSPKGKRMTRFDVGRIPHVRMWKPGDGPPNFLPEAEQAQRRNRGENVKTRTGLIMDPTDSSMKRIRQLEGNLKAQHNERVRKEQRALP